jgi:hypothetical protein
MQLRGLRIKEFSAGTKEDRVKFCLVICSSARSKSVTRSRIPQLIFFLLATEFAAAQADSSSYILRMEHEASESHLCVLLQKTGAFHMESDGFDSTRVFEGQLSAERLLQVERDLHDTALEALSQKQIDEPLIHRRDVLHVNISRDDHWQELTFYSAESQEPYRQSLQPLIRWLNELHKLPHKELSEDAGKNNCLAPGEIVLKKREDEAPVESASGNMNAAIAPQAPLPVPKREPVEALLRVFSMSAKSDAVRKGCVLITANGTYRAEERAQKVGSKKVMTKITGGEITPDEIVQLQQAIDSSPLPKIRHRETSHLVLPMSGEMLNLQIYRPSGVQELVLSSTFARRDVPFFYSGDGDISSAQALLKFIAEHIWTNGSGGLDPELRNDCQDAP